MVSRTSCQDSTSPPCSYRLYRTRRPPTRSDAAEADSAHALHRSRGRPPTRRPAPRMPAGSRPTLRRRCSPGGPRWPRSSRGRRGKLHADPVLHLEARTPCADPGCAGPARAPVLRAPGRASAPCAARRRRRPRPQPKGRRVPRGEPRPRRAGPRPALPTTSTDTDLPASSSAAARSASSARSAALTAGKREPYFWPSCFGRGFSRKSTTSVAASSSRTALTLSSSAIRPA